MHQVATGESLWEISERYQVALEEIARVNNISDPSRIMPITKIIIPGASQLLPKDVWIINGLL